MNESLQQIMILAFIMGMGFLLGKTKVLEQETESKINGLILKFALPALIFTSMDREFEQKLLDRVELVILWSVIWSALIMIILEIFMRKVKNQKTGSTAAFCTAFGNTSFMGMPIAQAMFGNDGLFYVACMCMVFNLLMFTYGIGLFQKGKKPDYKQLFLNPGVLATVAGFLIFMTPMTLPYVLHRGLSWCGDMAIPLALLVAGSTISRAKFSELFCSVKVWLVGLVRLVLFPIIMYPVLMLTGMEQQMAALITIVFATPAPLMSGAFAQEYGGDVGFANKVLVLSNLLSIVTMTALVYFLQCT